MDNVIAMMGSLVVASFLTTCFFLFSHKLGALSAFGRYPLSLRKLAVLSVAAFIPALGCFSSMAMVNVEFLLDNAPVMSLAMSTVAWMGWKFFGALEAIGLQGGTE